MKKPSALVRLKTAYNIFRYGFPAGKALPIAWPTWRQGVPAWKLINLQSYVDEGYSMNSLVYSAIMYKVRAVITAPLRAYVGDPYYPEPAPEEHGISRLVARPNEHQSWIEFQSLNIVYLNLDGNVYILKNPLDGTWNSLRPDRVYIIPTEGVPAKIAYYVYIPEGKSWKEGLPILPQDMIHIKLPWPGDELEGMGYGMSPLSPAAQSADVDNMVTSFLNIFFQRGSMVTGVLMYDVPIKQEIADVIRENWQKRFGGYDQWGVGILDRGGKYQRTALTFEEMGFESIDARNESRILAPFGVPPILIGAKVGLDRSTYSNYEGARKAVWEDTLLPEIKLFEDEYKYHLKDPEVFVKFDLSGVPALQKDMPKLVSAAYTLYQMGVPANQALFALGLRIGKVPDGDIPFSGRPAPGLAGRGQNQGPRSDADVDSWGQRTVGDQVDFKCSSCGAEVTQAFPGAKVYECSYCLRLYQEPSNGRNELEEIYTGKL